MSRADDFQRFAQALRQAVADWSLPIRANAIQAMWQHCELMVAANRRFNLTRIIDPAAAAVLHYADSLAVWCWVRQHKVTARQVLDVGTGAGFPAVPLAIVCPQWSLTAIDSTGKKARFVAHSAETLGLSNLQAVHARAGQWRPALPRLRFDLAVGRAIGSCEQALAAIGPLVARGGWILLYKTQRQCKGELKQAKGVMRKRRLKEGPHLSYRLISEGQAREYVLLAFGKR